MAYRRELEALRSEQEHVTFVDALVLVRLYRQRQVVDESFLSALAAWMTSPCLTDGARDVLESFLRTEGRRVVRERARSERSLGMADHGRRIRLELGSSLNVDLDRRDKLGLRWELASPPSGITTLEQTAPARPGNVRIVVTPESAGTHSVLLRENEIPHWERPSARTKKVIPRELLIHLIVSG